MDGQLYSFIVPQNAWCCTPTLDSIPDVNLEIGKGSRILPLTGISSKGKGLQNIKVRVSKSNANIATRLDYEAGNDHGKLIITPAKPGRTEVSVYVVDEGDSLVGGKNKISRSFVVNVTGSVASDIRVIETVRIYPLQATDILNVQLPGASYSLVSISNITGSVLHTFNVSGKSFFECPVSNLKPGLYILTVRHGNGTAKHLKFTKI